MSVLSIRGSSLLDQRNAALAAGGLADAAEEVPGRRLAVGEDVAAAHLLELGVAQLLLRRAGGLRGVALEDVVARQVVELLRRDLLRGFNHAVGVVGLSEFDAAHLPRAIESISTPFRAGKLSSVQIRRRVCREMRTCAFFPGVCEVEPFSELRGLGSSGGEKMPWPLSSFDFALDTCFFSLLSSSLWSVPLSSRCFATSAMEVGFLGETLSSSAKEM